MGKLMTVHLNDQNGIKYDQDKAFGVENLRSAFNQVKVLKENGYGENGEYVGLDVKAMRTTRDEDSYKHLENSLNIFKALEEKADRFDYEFQKKCVKNRDFEAIKGAHLFHFGYPTPMRRMYQNQGEELARMFRRIKEGEPPYPWIWQPLTRPRKQPGRTGKGFWKRCCPMWISLCQAQRSCALCWTGNVTRNGANGRRAGISQR